jgi:hypothetical protein
MPTSSEACAPVVAGSLHGPRPAPPPGKVGHYREDVAVWQCVRGSRASDGATPGSAAATFRPARGHFELAESSARSHAERGGRLQRDQERLQGEISGNRVVSRPIARRQYSIRAK